MRFSAAIGVFALAWVVNLGADAARARMFSIAELLDLYSQGHFEDAVRLAAQERDAALFRRGFEREAPAWISQKPGERDRRQLWAASFGLDIVALKVNEDWVGFQWMLEWGCAQLREHATPINGEATWYDASIALNARGREGTRGLSDHVAHAVARFPTSARFRFQLAVVQGFASDFSTDSAAYAALMRAYGDAAGDADLGAEAHTRMSHLDFRYGHFDGAAEHARFALALARDPKVTYLAQLLLGKALEALKRPDDAMAAYRAALTALPGGQSASLAIAAWLVVRDQPAEAHAIMEASLASRPIDDDPWRLFDYGDFWRYPAIAIKLHQELR